MLGEEFASLNNIMASAADNRGANDTDDLGK